MNFLPLIYEDELLYSIISRYKQMCGMVSKRAFLKDLFDDNVVLKSIFFPQYLNVLVNNFPPYSKITVYNIVMNNTMFPLYTAFLSEGKTNMIYKLMVEGSGRNIESMLGFPGSKVKVNKYLKSCSLCCNEDEKNLGESYWRRIHQIPGVLFCSKHGVQLQDSNVLNTDSRLDYCCVDGDAFNNGQVKQNSIDNDRIKALNLGYINNVNQLLIKNDKRKDLGVIISFYIDKLREKGFASKGGSIYMNDLLNEFVNYYSHEYLQRMQSDIDIEDKANWIRLFVRNNNKNRNPLRHLLFIQFLNINIEELFECSSAIGKVKIVKKRSPAFDLNERREKWLKIIKDNPRKNRSELKSIGKGLHTWLYTYDREWYDEVTPLLKYKKKKAEVIDWNKRDEQCLGMVKKAVERIINKDGKPVRIAVENIRREVGITRWFYDKRLVKTHQYINEVSEDITSYRIRKIKRAISEMINKELTVTPYKIQLYAGFGGNNKEVRLLIENILEDKEI